MDVSRPSEPCPRKAWARLQDGLFVVLTLVFWLAGSLLAALGAAMVVFFLLSGARLHPFFLQLHNMTVRYVAADEVRQAAFADLTVTAAAVLLACACLLRLPALCRRLRVGARLMAGWGA